MSATTPTSHLYAASHKKYGEGTISLKVYHSALASSSSSSTKSSSSLTSTLTFNPSNGGSEVVIALDDITKHQYSSEKDKKQMMRLTLVPPSSTTSAAGDTAGSKPPVFIFGLKTRADLEAIKETLQRSSGASRSNSPVPVQGGAESSSSSSSKGKKRSAEDDGDGEDVAPRSSTSWGNNDEPAKKKRKKSKVDKAKSLVEKTEIATARAKLLASDQELEASHRSLVLGNIMDEEEFWSTNADKVASIQAKIRGGESSWKMNDSATIDPHGSKVFSLTKDRMLQIFKMYPAVRKAYEEKCQKVPPEMTEDEFWVQYLQSDYFYRDRGEGVKKKAHIDDMFSRYEDEMERKESERRRRGGKARRLKLSGASIGTKADEFDLTSSLEIERPLGLRSGHNLYEDRESDAPLQTARSTTAEVQVLKKYNKHSTMRLGSAAIDEDDFASSKARPSAPASGPSHPPSLSSVDEAMELDKMVRLKGRPDESAYSKLNFKGDVAFGAKNGSAALAPGEGASDSNLDPEELRGNMDAALTSHAREVAEHRQRSFDLYPTKNLFPPDGMGKEIMRRLSKSMAESAFGEQRSTNIQSKLERRFKKKLMENFSLTRELLRHFFDLKRQKELMGANFGPKKEKHLQNVIAKIKEDHDTFNKEIRMYHDEGSAMSKIKAKMIIPMRDQLEHVYGLTGHAKGGWN